QARLAGRALDQVRRRDRAGHPAGAPRRTPRRERAHPPGEQPCRAAAAARRGRARTSGVAAMKALRFSRDVPRYAAARVAGSLVPGKGAGPGPLKLVDADPPEPPSDEWVEVRPRLAGICGSDLATVDGKSSRYFEPIVSFPFVPGHEVVGDLADDS